MSLFTYSEKQQLTNQLVDHYHQHKDRKEQSLNLENVYYDRTSQRLTFKIILITKKPKIVRYKQVNYERYPIYDGYSERSKIIKKFNKKILFKRFLEKDIFNITASLSEYNDQFDYEFDFFKKLIETIGYRPSWWENAKKIHNLKNEIKLNYKKLNKEKQKKAELVSTNLHLLKETPSYFWIYFIFAWFTFGLNFIFYTSKTQAKLNKESNQNKKTRHKKQLDSSIRVIRTLETEINNKKLALQKAETNNNKNTLKETETSNNKNTLKGTKNIKRKPNPVDDKDWADLKKVLMKAKK